MTKFAAKYSANQDIRDYMSDHSVGQRVLAEHMGVSSHSIYTMLKEELPQAKNDEILNHIDAIVADRGPASEENPIQDEAEEEPVESVEETTEETADVSNSTKFQVGDRVKVPAKNLSIGVIVDIWHSIVQDKLMYAVEVEGGSRGLYAENQLEPAPLPITYTFESYIDGNVAVSIMKATQGDKSWVHARGHAHIIHDGPVGLAQAVSYASRRMFEGLDAKQKNRIYVK